jgi:hypothetical protein
VVVAGTAIVGCDTATSDAERIREAVGVELPQVWMSLFCATPSIFALEVP